jgi:signal transduction histidine kinase
MKPMIRRTVYSIFISIIVLTASAQLPNIDSLKNELEKSKNDTTSLLLLARISDVYAEINFDSVYVYAEKMQALAKKLSLRLEEISAINNLGYALLNKGNFARSLQYFLTAIALSEDPASEKHVLAPHYPYIDEFSDRALSPEKQRLMKLSRTMQYTGILYFNAGNYAKALWYYHSSLPISEQLNNYPHLSITYSTLGRTFLALKKNDSALHYLRKAYEYANRANYNRYIGSILLNIGRTFLAEKNKDSALYYFRWALAESKEHAYYRGVAACNLAIADIHKQNGMADSNLYYARLAQKAAYDLNAPDLFLRSYTVLADYFKTKGNNDSAVKYQSLIIKINDSIFNSRQAQMFQNIDFDEQQRQQQIETAKAEYNAKLRTNLLLGGLAVILIIAIVLWRNSMQRKKANVLLSKQKKELESALATLKATQSQLVQSEKMASLGELTAGIAHEIQNPLNFVNNFSEVNRELIEELKSQKSKLKSEELDEILNNIDTNLEKINHHGKRADAIVKSMLQHSRSSSGKKELVDINALADEYLRLAFHGLRAKDKSFNARFETQLDPTIEKISVVPQDMGRVMLNLINNAFYAVSERKGKKEPGYEPTVTVTTKKVNDKIEVRVKDNGTGIPQSILEKIFQPFFTTKPTGQGTGLGLSLSYDIVKAQGGELKVETQEGEGSVFIIILNQA